MDGRKATGPHLPIRRLVAVMFNQAPLTAAESEHLTHCRTCMQDMVEATQKEIMLERDKADGGEDVG
jgi:hypothetical protein